MHLVHPLRVYIGYDPRQPLGYSVLQHSIAENASVPVAITPLILKQLPITRRGLTEFTYSRFLVPWLAGFKGQALFLDADMVVTSDIRELFASGDLKDAVRVRKDQPEFEWPSAMMFNCEHCRDLTPEFVEDTGNKLFDFKWARSVGSFPAEWNHCVGYEEPRPSKLYHFTQGLPCFFETAGQPEDQAWHQAHQRATFTVPWKELMGTSRHAEPVLRRLIKRYVK